MVKKQNKNNSDKRQEIIDKYPKMFNIGIVWSGFDELPGWYELIDNLCNCIQSYVDNNKTTQVTVEQIKEKFGTLRFYASGGDQLVHGMIWFAESLSENICEKCGKRGKLRMDLHWYKTLCDKCYNKYKKSSCITLTEARKRLNSKNKNEK